MSKAFTPAHTRRALQRLAFRLTAVLVLGFFFAPGILAQDITAEFDESADFTKFKTFAIREGQLISRALTAKNLTLVTGPADLNVFYQFGAARRMETESYPVGWRGMGTRVVRVPYSEGTLVIDLRDSATRSLVWRGIATEGERDPTKLAGKLDDMVKKSLAKYPPIK
jgi:hypothetical protein